MKYKLLVGALCCSFIGVFAGVSEHFIYDVEERYNLEGLDAIASVKIKQYYAFADIGLVRTLVEAKKTPIVAGQKGYCEKFYSTFPEGNAMIQLKRNSLWIFDAEITELFDGAIETNRVFIAMKKTEAYLGSHESPVAVAEDAPNNEVLFGLARIKEAEFEKSFLGLVCYLHSDLSIFGGKFDKATDSYLLIANGPYNAIFRDRKLPPCYVAREIGVSRRADFFTGHGMAIIEEESSFMKVLKEKGIVKEENEPREERKGASPGI